MWYKILKENLRHNGFQYQLGLNIDTLQFNPLGSCQPGGLYYTNKEHLFKFLDYGCYIADVKIPDNALTYKDPNGDKWKTNKLEILSIKKFEDHPLFADHAWRLAAVKHFGCNIQFIKNQTKKLCLAAVKQDGIALRYVKEQTDEICLAAVRENGNVLVYVKNQTDEICLAAVQQNGFALEFVKNQTDEICLAAVRENAIALRYVKRQNVKICLAAVQRGGFALRYVKRQNVKICVAAVRDTEAIWCFIDKKLKSDVRMALKNYDI